MSDNLQKQCDQCVRDFIEDIWNQQRFSRFSFYLYPDFIDHSLPKGMQDQLGLVAYLLELKKNIHHHTTIEKSTYEKDFIIIEVKIVLSALSDPLDKQFQDKPKETMTGHRVFALSDRRIIGHWEFLSCAR